MKHQRFKTKALLLSLAISGGGYTLLNAQETNMIAVEVDAGMSEIDKTPISSGILYDRAYPFAGLLRYAGTAGSGVSDPSHWLQAWQDLRNASYNPAGMESTDDLQSSAESSAAIPLGLIAYSFQHTDKAALADGSAYFSGDKLMASATPSTPLFKTRRAYVFSPLFFGKIESGKNYAFVFSNQFIKTNTGDAIAYMDLKTEENGASRRLYTGQSFDLVYESGGTKKWDATITFASGLIAQAYSAFEVEAPASALGVCARYFTPAENALLTTGHTPEGYTEEDPTKPRPGQGRGEAAIFYAKKPDGYCSGRLTRPVIFLDGFDSGDKRDINIIYNEFINYTDTSDTRLHMGEQFRLAGRDLVVLNFPDGDGLIERNAMVLVKLLQTLQSETYGEDLQEEFVIIGPSMGGLIARYALAYCEKNNIKHNTRLYISYDSPHGGAYIPLGVQQLPALFSFLGKVVQEQEKKAAYNSPAAKQMLLQHYSVYEGKAAHPYRAVFLRHLAEVGGYPKNMRKVSVINGSASGTAQEGITPGMELLKMEGIMDTVQIGNTQLIAQTGLLTIQVFASPASASAAAVTSRITLTRSVRRSFYGTGVGLPGLSPEALPGGYYTSTGAVAEQVGKPLGVPVPANITDRHCFIPSFSAVDLRLGSGIGYDYNFDGIDLVAAGLTPFDKVYAPGGINEQHVQLSPQSAGWFKSEILGDGPFDKPKFGRLIYMAGYGEENTFTGYTAGASQFVWTVGADALINGIPVPAGQPTTAGGTIKLAIPCQTPICRTGDYTVRVYAAADYYHTKSPEAFFSVTMIGTPPPNGGPVYDQARTAVMPNPAKGELTVHLGNGEGPDFEKDHELVLFSPYGQAVRQLKSKKKKVKMDAAGLPAGVYYLHHLSPSGTDKIRVILEN